MATPAGGRSRSGQDAHGQNHGRVHPTGFERLQFTPDLLPADLIGTVIYNPRTGRVYDQARPDLFQPHPGRRNQSRAGEGPERAA